MRRTLALLLSLIAIATPLAAQRPPRLEIALPPAAGALKEGPAIVTDGLLSDAKTREHLRNGFPARIHYRLELWRKSGVLSGDDRSGTVDWDVLVNYDPTSNLYNMIRRSSDDSYRENFGFSTLSSAEIQLAKPYKTSLHPTRSGRYYYNLTVEVQTLAQSDLDATLQWLRGSTAPGKTSNPITVIRSGVGTLFSRLLGGAQNKYEQPSEVFSVP